MPKAKAKKPEEFVPANKYDRFNIIIKGARTNNLKNVDLTIPIGFREVFYHNGYTLRGGSKTLCRKPFFLRPSISYTCEETRC